MTAGVLNIIGGERGIRTPGPLQVNGFQDRRNRPLCHLSVDKFIKTKDYCKPFFYFF